MAFALVAGRYITEYQNEQDILQHHTPFPSQNIFVSAGNKLQLCHKFFLYFYSPLN